ncbi:MAG: hypothetical protein HYS13_18390 [Planctomycetia bacterium]|nr:hypothetical protein [Planctomycetia bacterium]
MALAWLPERFLVVEAFLLDPGVPPLHDVLVGLETIDAVFDLHSGPSGRYLQFATDSRRVFLVKTKTAPARLCVEMMQFESVSPNSRFESRTVWPYAVLDTGSSYLVIPHCVHKLGQIKVHADLGKRRYRHVVSMPAPIEQRFVKVGIRFLGET